MNVICYPWVARKGLQNADPLTIYIFAAQTANQLETASAISGTVIGDANTYGWTPFMNRKITEYLKLGKPRKVFLQGGQSYIFTVRDNKPMYLNYSKLASTINAANPSAAVAGSIGGRTRGCFLVFRSNPLNDDTTSTLINWGNGSAIVQAVESYEWVASPMPHRYRDMVPDTTAILNANIIQPQTGAVNNAIQFL